jgi:hypothetical protein
MTYACPAREFAAETHLLIAVPAKEGSQHNWQTPEKRAGPRFAYGFPNSVRL